MGINIPNIQKVVIYIIPDPEPHLYLLLQHSGRAGRNSKKAEVFLLFKQ